MHAFLLPLDSPDATLADAGGKGLNLSKLVRAASRCRMASSSPRRHIVLLWRQIIWWDGARRRLARPKLDDPAALEATSQAIRARFAAGVAPAELVDAVAAAYEPWAAAGGGALLRHRRRPARYVLRRAAGYLLNVLGEEALLQAVVAAGAACGPPAPSATVPATASPTTRWRWPWWCRRWCKARQRACFSPPTR